MPTEYKEPSADQEEQRASGVAAIGGVLPHHDSWQCLEEFNRELGWGEEEVKHLSPSAVNCERSNYLPTKKLGQSSLA